MEDDPHKALRLMEHLQKLDPRVVPRLKQSVSSAKDALREETFAMVVLDMSLPSFDIDHTESGGIPQVYGGRELLGYLDFLDLTTPAVVITQFDRFESGGEILTIETLGQTLSKEFPRNFKGAIFYSSVSDTWRDELSTALSQVL